MERALVIYESMFGNTRAIAEEVAHGLSARCATELVEVGRAPAAIPPDVSVVVVGAPTHAFGLSRPKTRHDAATRTDEQLDTSMGLREWLHSLPRPRPGIEAVAFDTRIDSPRLPGSAARAAERRLRKLGFSIAAPAQSFFVTGTKGPLLGGELERARTWAKIWLAAGDGRGPDDELTATREPPFVATGDRRSR
jgi:hypothetical protein